MPVSVEELHELARPLRDRVLEFLRRNPAQAYSAWEVFTALQGFEPSWSATLLVMLSKEQRDEEQRECVAALDELAASGEVCRSDYRGVPHYYAGKSS